MFHLFFIITYLIIAINLFLLLRAFIKHKDDEVISDETPKAVVIIPCYNEKDVIIETVRMLYLQTYSDYEIVVIDDGSKDNTSGTLVRAFNMREDPNEPYTWRAHKLTVIRRPHNQGKHAALNAGVVYAKSVGAEWVLTVDADTLVDTNCLENMFKKKQEDADAVTCMIGIANGNRNLYKTTIPLQILPRIQWLDYLRTFIIFRNSVKDLNTIVIMPGSCSLISMKAIDEVGGWSGNTITEDMEFTLQMHRHEMKIQYLSEILGWTQCPFTWIDTGRQRIRWKIGMMQTLVRFPMLWFQKNNKPLTYFMIPYVWMTEFLSPVLEFVCVVLLIASALGVINIPFADIAQVWVMIAMSYLVITIIMTEFISRKLTLENGPTKIRRLVILSIFEGFTYHFIFLWWHLKAVYLWASGKFLWNKVSRKNYH